MHGLPAPDGRSGKDFGPAETPYVQPTGPGHSDAPGNTQRHPCHMHYGRHDDARLTDSQGTDTRWRI